MKTPDNLRYTRDHEWVLIDGTTARVGITDYAQDALGDIVYVKLPTVGSTASASESIGEIESTKSVNDVYAPFAAAISKVNERLSDNPELLNSDPYGEGWICEMDVAGQDISGLLSAEEYIALVGG